MYFSAGKFHTSHYVNEIIVTHLKANAENQFPLKNRINHLGEFTSHTMYLQDLMYLALAMCMSPVFSQADWILFPLFENIK